MADFSLILASSSPQRQQMLGLLGLPFTIQHADIDERVTPGESPDDYVCRLARAKAETILKQCSGRTSNIVLGADTCIYAGLEILGKPCDFADARRVLRLLSNRWHQVFTAVTVLSCSPQATVTAKTKVVASKVKFRSINEAEIVWYWQTGEPQDKAGAYAVQGVAGIFIERIEGSFSAIVGLPMCETVELLSGAGLSVELREYE